MPSRTGCGRESQHSFVPKGLKCVTVFTICYREDCSADGRVFPGRGAGAASPNDVKSTDSMVSESSRARGNQFGQTQVLVGD